jgi:hypothetical protein
MYVLVAFVSREMGSNETPKLGHVKTVTLGVIIIIIIY